MKKPLIVYIEDGLVGGYKLPKGTTLYVVDLDSAKQNGEECRARVWLKKLASGLNQNEATWHSKFTGWYRA
jgi:hypothetical protein